jgi:hypothetical protein
VDAARVSPADSLQLAGFSGDASSLDLPDISKRLSELPRLVLNSELGSLKHD